MVMIRRFPKGMHIDNKRIVDVDGAQDAVNVVLNRNGDLENRFGWDVINSSVTSYNIDYIFSNTINFDYLQLTQHGIYQEKKYIGNPVYSSKREKISYNNLGLSRLTGVVWELIDAISGNTFPQFISTPTATYIPNGKSLLKYDGNSVSLAGGFFQQDEVPLTDAVPTPDGLNFNLRILNTFQYGKLTTGLGNVAVFKYAARLKQVDANLNTVYSDFLNLTYDTALNQWLKYKQVSTTNVADCVAIDFIYNGNNGADTNSSIVNLINNYFGGSFRYAIVKESKYTSVAGNVTVVVEAGHTLKAGDLVPFNCNLNFNSNPYLSYTPTVRWLKVDSVTATTVVFQNPNITMIGVTGPALFVTKVGNILSGGVSLELFRTKGGANDFYKIMESGFPLAGYSAPQLGRPSTAGANNGFAVSSVAASEDLTWTAHDLNVDDTVFFMGTQPTPLLDQVYYVHTVVGPNTIKIKSTIAGAAITMTETKAFAGTSFGFNPNEDYTSTIVDSIPDSSLNIADGFFFTQLYTPDIPESFPPNTNLFGVPHSTGGCYHQDSLFLYGDPENPNLISVSDPGEYEVFKGLSSISVGDLYDGKVKSCQSINDTLIVCCERQTFIVSGQIYSGNYRVDRCGVNSVGCQSNLTMKEIDGELFFLHSEGLYSIRAGADPQEESTAIRPLFLKMTDYNFQLARGCVDDFNNRYFLYIPHNTSGYMMLMYDFYFREWFKFENFDCSNGIASFQGEIMFQSGLDYKESNYNSRLDDATPISWLYVDQEINLNHPEFKTKNLWFDTFSIPSSINETAFVPNFSCSVEQFYNWSSTPVPTKTITFTPTKFRINSKFDSNQVYSHKVKFSGNSNEFVRISGWTLWSEDVQTKMT